MTFVIYAFIKAWSIYNMQTPCKSGRNRMRIFEFCTLIAGFDIENELAEYTKWKK